MSTIERASIELALVSHTNAGKTTLARTLLGRDIGEVRDAPHVTDLAQAHVLLETPQGDVLRLWDTPGFGDSARLVQRLASFDNPIGWLLREVWDRYRNRPLWSSQQAVRAAREEADVVLYLVNAAEHPNDARYVGAEMRILAWIGKPVVALLNQMGPPRPAAEEQADIERWRKALDAFPIVRDVLPLDAFARCWVQEGVLLRALERCLPGAKQAAMRRLGAAWQARSLARFHEAIAVLARQLAAAARDREPIAGPAAAERRADVLAVLGLRERAPERAHEAAMAALAERTDAAIRESTERLIALHGLEGKASDAVLERLRTSYSVTEPMSEGKAAAAGGIASGALAGLMADLASGGLTLGAGILAGAIVGALGAAGIARGHNIVRGAQQGTVAWSAPFLDGLARSALLRYLAIAHFGRGRGAYAESESPAFWRNQVERVVAERRPAFDALWENARESDDGAQIEADLAQLLTDAAEALLEALYPAAFPRPADAPR